MDKFIFNQSNNGKRVRLTREELLAGKCFSEDDKPVEDPRLKSPDIVLERSYGSRTPSSEPATDQRVKQLTEELKEFQQRYTKEIGQWKDYQTRVEEWKNQVLQVVAQMKTAANDRQGLVDQLKNLKSLLELRDQQILRLKKALLREHHL